MTMAETRPADPPRPYLIRVPDPCRNECGTCDDCLIKLAGQSVNRLLWGRWLVQNGRVTDEDRDDLLHCEAWQDGETK
jgi:hypothetical protein